MTKYEIYTEDLADLIADHFKSKKEFRKKLGISPSHLHKLLIGAPVKCEAYTLVSY